MFQDEWIEKIIASFDDDREVTLDILKQILNFPFHPDTKLILFEVTGNSGIFGLVPFVMKDSDYHIDEDAFGTPLLDTPFNELSFGFSGYNYLENEVKRMSSDEIGELDDLAINCLCQWFANLYHEVRGNSPISCMIQIHDSTGVYSLKEREWLTEEEFEDYFETMED